MWPENVWQWGWWLFYTAGSFGGWLVLIGLAFAIRSKKVTRK